MGRNLCVAVGLREVACEIGIDSIPRVSSIYFFTGSCTLFLSKSAASFSFESRAAMARLGKESGGKAGEREREGAEADKLPGAASNNGLRREHKTCVMFALRPPHAHDYPQPD